MKQVLTEPFLRRLMQKAGPGGDEDEMFNDEEY